MLNNYLQFLSDVFHSIPWDKTIAWLSTLSAGAIISYCMIFHTFKGVIVRIVGMLIIIAVMLFLWDSGFATIILNWIQGLLVH